MTVSNAQGEYEQLERERVEEDMRLAGQAMGKRDLDQEGGEDGPAGKKAKTEHVEEDEDMEMDMEEDDDDGMYDLELSTLHNEGRESSWCSIRRRNGEAQRRQSMRRMNSTDL